MINLLDFIYKAITYKKATTSGIKEYTSNVKFYSTACDHCKIHLGYLVRSEASKIRRCRYCANKIKIYKKASKARKEFYSNIDYSNYITTIDPTKKRKRLYKMYCRVCGKDRGFLGMKEARRRCIQCVGAASRKKQGSQRKIYNCMKANINVRLSHRGIKDYGIFRHLPYSLDDLMSHLEAQFEPWMNWDNHGLYHSDGRIKTWQIDHIIADANFQYSSVQDQGFKDSWALDNLQPLESLANILKSDKE